jgi:ankyrin repeat protein
MSKLPPNPSLTHLKNQAKALRKGLKAGEPQAFKRLREALPHYQGQPDDALSALTLVDAQLVIAREYGFAGWVALREAVRTSDPDPADREAHLLEAVIQNDAETVKALLAQDSALVNIQGPFPNYSSGGEFQLLYIAAVKGNAEIVGILLDYGADIHATQEENWTALTQAILRRHRDHRHHGTVDLLIDRGARVGIDAAVMMDDRECVKVLLDGDPDLVNHVGAGNSLPINLVKSVEMARLLLDHGADPGVVELSGFAAHPELAAFFIENGATVDIESAIGLDDIERAQTLLVAEPGLDMRDSLVSVKSVEMARLLLDHGADPNAKVDGGHEHTPLGNAVHHFADSGRKELAEFLIENGAEVDIVVAAGLGDIDQVRAFLKRDADLANARSYDGFTALHATLSAEIVRLLLDHGADPNIRVAYCNGGYTVLQIKLWQRDLGLIEMLLDRGADPRGQDSLRGWTATEWAERWHRWEEARALLAGYEKAA